LDIFHAAFNLGDFLGKDRQIGHIRNAAFDTFIHDPAEPTHIQQSFTVQALAFPTLKCSYV
jgi:hypothetical protein